MQYRNMYPGRMSQFPPTGNVIRVESLEHAMSMPTSYHSENVYFDSHQNLLYRVYTNEFGEKSSTILALSEYQMPNVEPVTNDMYNALLAKVTKLEKDLEVLNGKLNVSTNAGADQQRPETGQSDAQ